MAGPGAWAPFHEASPDLQARLLAGTEVLVCREGRPLVWQGDPVRRAWLVLEGAVHLQLLRSDSSTLDLGTEEGGGWIGLAELVVGGPALADATPGPGCRVLAVDALTFGRWRHIPEVASWLAGELARRVYSLHSRVEVVRPAARLARWLAARAPLAVATQEDLAAALGTTRETVNRTLARLQDDGWVQVIRGAVRVLDPEALARWNG